MHAYASIIMDDRYLPTNDLGNSDEQERSQNDDQILVAQRSAHFIFPPTAFIHPSGRSNDHLDFRTAKRQSFGRKHHWDAFFGRRR
jgi:hypothetical protein